MNNICVSTSHLTYLFLLQVLLTFVGLSYFGAFKFMYSMGQATYDPSGNLIDGGIDLNMESGMAEYASFCAFCYIVADN